MITVIMISITEKMKRIILANLNGHKLSFLLKLSAAARSKRKERLFSTQITSPRKRILPWGLMALRESDLNGCCSKRKMVLVYVF